ncbi:hypothetical protein Vqi01_12660 [Micromonospora qiuiae]|uniref:Uncharacterized protein n=1 Tax=Micromonospora qiuiae TaxID=502268 RepID=A0ABQ4J7F1_9ACTN|nr:hypothetical protein [Micromonospora qiuiae]GIJ26104.1 hypothetical protein Vqi01_12660 [Micromonospora qiuiae]
MGIARRILLAMALAVTATLLVPATSASAAGQPVTICFRVGEFNGMPIFDCHTIVLPDFKPKPIGPDGCLSCPPVFDLWDQIHPKERVAYLDQLGRGLSLLGEAAQCGDPGKAAALRKLATESFLSSAKLLNGSAVKLAQVGWADLKNGKFYADPTPQPSLEASGQHLVAGLGLMQKSLLDVHPETSIKEAMARFDLAYKELGALFAG